MKFKTLQDDLTFKYVFSHHEILKDLIDSFLKYMNIRNEVTFTNIKIQDYMLPNKQTIKGFFGDIVVTLDNGYILSIEMYKSIFSKRDYKKNFSYLCKLCMEQMKKGFENYEDIKKVIGISFIKGNFRKQNNNIINSYEFKNNQTFKVIDEGDLELYLVRLDLVNKRRYNVYKEERFIRWLRFLNAQSIEELEMIGKGDEIMENSIRVVKEWVEESSKEGFERYVNKMTYEAREKGMRAGMKAGIKEGKKEGMKEGFLEAQRENAKNMLGEGLALDVIMRITGLSKKQILELQ